MQYHIKTSYRKNKTIRPHRHSSSYTAAFRLFISVGSYHFVLCRGSSAYIQFKIQRIQLLIIDTRLPNSFFPTLRICSLSVGRISRHTHRRIFRISLAHYIYKNKLPKIKFIAGSLFLFNFRSSSEILLSFYINMIIADITHLSANFIKLRRNYIKICKPRAFVESKHHVHILQSLSSCSFQHIIYT